MYFTITEDWLEDNRTQAGGYTSAQIKVLGWDKGIKTKGWKSKSIGKVITDEQKFQFEILSTSVVSKTKAKKIAKQITNKERIDNLSAQSKMRDVESANYQRNWTDEFIASAAFLKTHEWAKTRMLAITKYGNWCSCCGAKPSKDVFLCVDHIKPRKFFPKLALDVKNLQILCSTCNLGKGNAFSIDWNKDYMTQGQRSEQRESNQKKIVMDTSLFPVGRIQDTINDCRSQVIHEAPW